MSYAIWAAEDALKGLSGAEWGFIGVLTFVIIGAFTTLLTFVLRQAGEDRKLFRETSEANIKALQEINLTMKTMQAEIARIRDDIDDRRSEK